MTEGDTDPSNIKQRYNVADAARLLGISPEAVRTRLSRGKLESVKEGRRVWVLLDPDMTDSDAGRTSDTTEEGRYVRSLEEQVEHLRGLLDGEREANRENRRIIAALTSRIPELEPVPPSEAPRMPQEEPEPPSEGEDPEEQQRGVYRPWWRRIFD